MNNPLNKKLAEMLGKMDEKVLQTKINAALDMLKKGNTEELAKKLNKVDKEELVSKINEFDDSKLQGLNINKEEIKEKIQNADLDKLSQLLGDHGDEIIGKIKNILNKV
jgi:hypothetical protein